MAVSGVRAQDTKQRHLFDLPNEILQLISGHLEARDVGRMISTCRCLSLVLNEYLLRRIARSSKSHRTGDYEELARRVLYATDHNQPEALSKLMEFGASFCFPTPSSFGRHFDHCSTPLCRAARHGYIEVARVLLDGGMNANGGQSSESNMSPLFTAIESGDLEIVRLLLTHGASQLRFRDSRCDVPLALAAARGFTDVVKLPLQFMKQGNHPEQIFRVHCREACHSAVRHAHGDVLEFLMQNGASLIAPWDSYSLLSHAVDSSQAAIVEILLNHNVKANGHMLILACEKDDFDTAKLLAKDCGPEDLEWAINKAESVDRDDVATSLRLLLEEFTLQTV